MIKIVQSYFNLSSVYKRFKNSKISILSYFDENCSISTLAKVYRFVSLRNVNLGDYSYVGPNSHFVNVQIGKFCSISKNVNIGLYLHPKNFISTSPLFFRVKNGTGSTWVSEQYFDDMPLRTIIGNDVWIGLNVSISGGVTIGDGAIIAAHSMVTKSVPPYAIVGGVPAKVIGYRFDEDLIQHLFRIKWWDKDEQILREYIDNFNKPISAECLNKLILKFANE